VRLQRDTPFDVWGGVDQALTYQPPAFDAHESCNPVWGGSYQGVSNLKGLVRNANRYVLAEYLNKGNLKVCLSAAWVDEEVEGDCDTKPGCRKKAKFQFTLYVMFNDVSIEIRSLKYDKFEEPKGDANSQKAARWNDPAIREKFAKESFREAPSPELAKQRADLLNKVTNDVQEQLRLYQLELYRKLFNEMQSGSLRPVVLELSGAKALLDSFITLGLPSAVANDDLLRALMFGSQRAADDDVVTDFYATAISNTTTIATAQVMTDTRVALNQLALQRANALDGLLMQYLDAIGANTHAEAFDLVADARLELRLAQKLAKLGGAVAKIQVFLPMVRK
jgi:hypothetical protein